MWAGCKKCEEKAEEMEIRRPEPPGTILHRKQQNRKSQNGHMAMLGKTLLVVRPSSAGAFQCAPCSENAAFSSFFASLTSRRTSSTTSSTLSALRTFDANR
eukprot:TRINITY_DN59353_c0_g1_i1.p2 TRINITY_DN59353_c0_g1~~TRINITY_DN59353_c0_g1_i1.p2  ORF type:complete len:101 (+),score=8.82 TRINITY_DN59353_c0_g1_i1:331-633(+)